jgi:hypothetical protein
MISLSTLQTRSSPVSHFVATMAFNELGCVQWPVLSENGDLYPRVWCSFILSRYVTGQ